MEGSSESKSKSEYLYTFKCNAFWFKIRGYLGARVEINTKMLFWRTVWTTLKLDVKSITLGSLTKAYIGKKNHKVILFRPIQSICRDEKGIVLCPHSHIGQKNPGFNCEYFWRTKAYVLTRISVKHIHLKHTVYLWKHHQKLLSACRHYWNRWSVNTDVFFWEVFTVGMWPEILWSCDRN